MIKQVWGPPPLELCPQSSSTVVAPEHVRMGQPCLSVSKTPGGLCASEV